jgi:hypothetical protein
MIAMGADELHGKTIEDVAIYTDVVLMTLADGKAVVLNTPNGLRVQVGERPSRFVAYTDPGACAIIVRDGA